MWRFEHKQTEALAFYDGATRPDQYNADDRHWWWEGTSHTLQSAIAASVRRVVSTAERAQRRQPGLLAALAASVSTIERDSPGYMTAIASSVATAADSSSSGGASYSRAPRRHDVMSTSQGASGSCSAAPVKIEEDSDDEAWWDIE